ncbi:MAG: ABC transporter substrate-binding protein, partial [Nitriliruptoraceae bacterium]
IRLTAVDDHPSAALLDEVLFTIYPDDEAGDQQWEDLQEGQLHVGRIPVDRRAEVEARFGGSIDGYRGPGLIDGVSSSAYLYGFNVTEEPFDDPRLRRALSLAIDRESLAEDLLDGTRVAATSIIPPPFPGAQPDACEHCRHDPLTAVQLLEEVVDDLAAEEEDDATAEGEDGDEDGDDEAEGDDGDAGSDAAQRPDPAELIGRIQLLHNRGATHTAIAERLADDIEQVLGLEVDFQAIGLQPFIRSVRAGDVPVFRMGWDVSGPDIDSYLWPLFHSSQIGRDNLTRYENPEVDELLERARATTDAEERLELYQQAERKILRDVPAIPVLWDRHRLAIALEVRGLEVSPYGRFTLEEAWLDPESG